MKDRDTKSLLKKYLDGQCTPEEILWVESWYNHEYEQRLDKKLQDPTSEDRTEMLSFILENIKARKSITQSLYRYVAAASILMALSAAIFFILDSRVSQIAPLEKIVLKDVSPGTNKATLTLSDGTTLRLDSVAVGATVNERQTSIQKTADGRIAYKQKGTESNSNSEIFNTITTPRGGQFMIVLPDGTKVWLNAASSMKYPVSFREREGMGERGTRSVTVSGEAYFEVAKDASRPFIVYTPNQKIEVLGTHFNVNAYPDEKETRTTLLEGSVKVFSTKLNLSKILNPGQAAIHQSKELFVTKADENAVAWKDGKMNFNETGLPTLMREVSRWYDLDVVYVGKISTRKFTGGIRRNTNLSTLLEIMNASDIDFVIEQGPKGKRLIVKSN